MLLLSVHVSHVIYKKNVIISMYKHYKLNDIKEIMIVLMRSKSTPRYTVHGFDARSSVFSQKGFISGFRDRLVY